MLGEYKIDVELRQKLPWERDEELLQLNPSGELPILDDAAKGVFCGARVISEWLEETAVSYTHLTLPTTPYV